MRAAEFADLSAADEILSSDNVYAVTDSNVAALRPDLFSGVPHTVMPAGEAHKNLETVGGIISDMVAAGCDRRTTVVAVGGGVVGDTAGFAAACYMRGVKWINVPTTLLAMVDSGIGGKTGVDVRGYKNVAGAFHMPERVVICREWLDTLPGREWLCGCGEMIKHALLSAEIFDATYPAVDRLIARDMSVAVPLAEMSARYKESVVAADFREGGLRKRLNVGHTVGHAVEKLDSFRLSHGEYVALGIITEMTMMRERVGDDFYGKAVSMARAVCTHPSPKLGAEEITDAARADKKNGGGRIVIMLPTGGGNVEEIALEPREFTERLEKCLSSL